MARSRGNKGAFGTPGYQPRWTHAGKEGIGTAYSTGSRVWRFSFTKEIIAKPTRPCVLPHTQLEGNETFLNTLKTYLLCAPHLEVGGEGNSAFVVEVSGRELLVADKENRWLALGASSQFSRLPCGYVGHGDGYTDVLKNHEMTFEFDEAKSGNVALTGELELSKTREFTIGVAFAETLPSAVSCLFQSLGFTYKEQRKIFIRPTGIGGEYFDLAPTGFHSQVDFTFFWTNRVQWEGQNHRVQTH